MQVAGRAGRAGLAGEVLIQTRYPMRPRCRRSSGTTTAVSPASSCASRGQAGLPPFAYQALLTTEHREVARALEFLGAARELGEALVAELGAPVFLHATPCR